MVCKHTKLHSLSVVCLSYTAGVKENTVCKDARNVISINLGNNKLSCTDEALKPIETSVNDPNFGLLQNLLPLSSLIDFVQLQS